MASSKCKPIHWSINKWGIVLLRYEGAQSGSTALLVQTLNDIRARCQHRYHSLAFPLWKEVDQVSQCGLVGGQRTREKVKLLCITKGQEFEGGRIERREEEKSE